MKVILIALPFLLLIGLAACARFNLTGGIKPFGARGGVSLDFPRSPDFSAVAIIERLNDGLQVTFEVQDRDVIVYPHKELWESDGVEFYADLRSYRERAMFNHYAPGVFQITVQAPVGSKPPVWSFRSVGLPVPAGFQVNGKRTKSGYIIQLFLPEETTREIHGPFRETIYLDAAVNNVRPDGTAEKFFWRGNGDNWKSPRNFAPVTVPVHNN